MSKEIPTSREFLDALARGIAQIEGKSEPVSDYRLSQVLGVSRAWISKIRKGPDPLTPAMSERIAEIMGVPYEWVRACIHVERAQNVAQKTAWERAARKLAGWVIPLIIGGILAVSAPRAEARVSGDVNIHYAQYRLRDLLRRLGLRRLIQGSGFLFKGVSSHAFQFCPSWESAQCAA